MLLMLVKEMELSPAQQLIRSQRTSGSWRLAHYAGHTPCQAFNRFPRPEEMGATR